MKGEYQMLFREYLINEKQLALSTTEAYERIAKEFTVDLKKNNGDVKKAMYEYTIRKVEEQLSPGSFNYYLSGINNFIRYLVIYRPDDVPLKNSNFKMKHRKFDYLPQIQSAKTIGRIHSVIKNHTAFNTREKLIISLALNHGLLPADFMNIEYQDICFKKNEIVIYKKDNNIPRYVFLLEHELELLTEYIANKPIKPNDSSYIFSNGCKPLSSVTLLKVLDKLSELLGENITFKKLRNTFIVDCLACEINPMYVMVYMGIKNLVTVLNYERLNINRFAEVLRILKDLRYESTKENQIKILLYYRKTIAILANTENQNKENIKLY